jgi:hypothetical protein
MDGGLGGSGGRAESLEGSVNNEAREAMLVFPVAWSGGVGGRGLLLLNEDCVMVKMEVANVVNIGMMRRRGGFLGVDTGTRSLWMADTVGAWRQGEASPNWRKPGRKMGENKGILGKEGGNLGD